MRATAASRVTPADTTTFDYDLGGRLVGVANSAVSLTFGYNARDELETETATLPGLSALQVAREYDRAGNVTKITYPDATFFTYDYDELDRLRFLRDSAGAALEQRTYDELSRLEDRILSNG